MIFKDDAEKYINIVINSLNLKIATAHAAVK